MRVLFTTYSEPTLQVFVNICRYARLASFFCVFILPSKPGHALQARARPFLGPAAASSHRTTPQLIVCVRADHMGALKLSSFPPLCWKVQAHADASRVRSASSTLAAQWWRRKQGRAFRRCDVSAGPPLGLPPFGSDPLVTVTLCS